MVCISDTHGRLEAAWNAWSGPERRSRVPEGDVLVHAGDFTSTGRLTEVRSFRAMMDSIDWLDHQVIIAGNHETTFDAAFYRTNGPRFHRPVEDASVCRAALLAGSSPRLHYLENTGIRLCGLEFWGSPYTPSYFDWAFNLERGAELRSMWAKIPDRLDVLVTHGPPARHGSFAATRVDAGCEDLLARVLDVAPALHVFGHIHEGYGVTREGSTVFVNAATCTLRYRAENAAVVVDLIPPEG